MPVRAKIASGAGKKKRDDKKDKKDDIGPPPIMVQPTRRDKKKKSNCCGASGPDADDDNQLVLRVHVIGAKNLAAKDEPEDKSQSKWGLSDPYCIVYCGTEKLQTHHIEKELSPTWDTIMEFTNFEPETCYHEYYCLKEDGMREMKKESALKIEVYDKDEGNMETNDLIGRAQLPFPYELWSKRHTNPEAVFDEKEVNGEMMYVVKKEAWGASGMKKGERPGSPLLALDLINLDEDDTGTQFQGQVLMQCLVMHKWELEHRNQMMWRAKTDERERKINRRNKKYLRENEAEQAAKKDAAKNTLKKADRESRDSGPNLGSSGRQR